MLWTPNLGPMGVTREQVVLDWLKQPGNCERFMQAGSTNKRPGTVSENKREVASLVCTLLQNAGFHGHTRHGVVIKLIAVIKCFRRAHALVASGANESQVRDECPFYYDLVNHIGTVINASNKYYPERRRVLRPRLVRQATSRAVRIEVPESTRPPNRPPAQHKKQLPNQQARKTRIEEIQAHAGLVQQHAVLVQQMREAGFSKNEIASHLQLLQQ